jgi:hypothetical protein
MSRCCKRSTSKKIADESEALWKKEKAYHKAWLMIFPPEGDMVFLNKI